MSARRVVLAGVTVVMATIATASAQPGTGETPPPEEVTPPPDQAGVDANERCAKAYDDLVKGLDPSRRGDGCRFLAEHVADEIRNALAAQKKEPLRLPGKAAEPTLTDTSGQDSAAQTSAVASGEPVPQAGGTVSLAGVPGTGLQMVTALAVNPLGLANGEDDDGADDGEIDAEQFKDYAWSSRFVDVSVILPIDLDAAGAVKEGFQYYGLRARINLATLIWDPKDNTQAIEDAFKPSFALDADYVDKSKKLLAATSTPKECAEALIDRDSDAQETSCGESLDRASADEAYTKARAALDQFREKTDNLYATLELRLDRGDVNGDAAPSRDTLFASYLSAGYRKFNKKQEMALRVRGGLGYFKDGLTQTDRTVAYVAGGLELALLRDQGKFIFTVGAEAQRVKDQDGMTDPTNTDFTNIRVGLGVPLADGKQLSVGIAFPEKGGEPQLTVSGDWALLFGP